MKLAWLTDPHLNFLNPLTLEAFYQRVRDVNADALLITGDIAEGDCIVGTLKDLYTAVDRPIYFVLGNHDYYQSSIASVREKVRLMCEDVPGLTWLHECNVSLNDTTSLVGVDGWADAKLGAPEKQRIGMADWDLIKEYRVLGKWDHQARMQFAADTGRKEAYALRIHLNNAAEESSRILVATHIPPFKEATWHQGKHSDNDWLPWFSCQQTGEVLADCAAHYPHVKFEVYCGHTHGEGVYQHSDNLIVHTGAARYGWPDVCRVIEV